MKRNLKHILMAAVPFWTVQLIVLASGYTDVHVVLRIYLTIFVVGTLGLLFGRVWMGHGLLLSASLGLVVEWLLSVVGGGSSANHDGVVLGTAILLGGASVSILLQAAVDFWKKRAAGTAA